MTELPARDLRNDVSAVLRRVAGGERLRVTLRGKPVAELGPVPSRPGTIPWSALRAALASGAADKGLAADLEAALTGTTDDVEPS